MRKDLDALADEGHIIKVHGSVALANSGAQEIPFDLRVTKNAIAKRRIAAKAITLLDDGDTILMESCTTNLELAKQLTQYPNLLETLTIVTNSFSIASIFDGGRKCKKMFFLGGWVNTKQYSALCAKTVTMLKEFHVSKAFLSGAALSKQLILTGYYDDDVSFQKNALLAAQEVILMLDSSKFDQTAIFTVGHLSEFDYLITDKTLSEEEQEYMQDNGVQYIAS